MPDQLQSTFQLRDDDVVIDDCFVIRESRFGLFNSITLQGRRMLTGGTYEGVETMTRWHLKCEQDGTLDQYSRVIETSSYKL